ncbi:MAG: 30S ribosome-binding factor RbfA [Actinobacteria bacterium]|nr:30S ribosome-binding factor RbfA [Actinomycetota bacterium]
MPKTYPRGDRVEEQVRHVLSEAVAELKDPRVGFVTITAVKVTPDLRHAKVFVSALGSRDQRDASIEAVRHAAPHLRSVLGREVRLKYLPFLEIVEDTTADQGERIESLLREVGVSKPPSVEKLDDAGELEESDEADETS